MSLPTTARARIVSCAVLATLGVAFGAVGCGGGAASAGAEVEEVVRSFYGALVDGDGEKACSLLAPRIRPTVPPQGSGHTCESTFAAFPHILGANWTAQMRDWLTSTELRVEVAGDSATVYLPASPTGIPKDPGTFRLERAGDGWQITLAARAG